MLLAAAETGTAFVGDLLVILASAAAVALVMQRLRLAVIPAYLIAGAVLGPHALGLIPSPESLAAIGHLAIILLLFGIGLELHLTALRHGLGHLVTAGLVSCTGCVLIGWPLGLAFGLPTAGALAVSMALSLSSTAVVLRIIAKRRELGHARGRLALAILVIQDMIVLLMLAVLPGLAKWAGTYPALATDAAETGGALAVWGAYIRNVIISIVGVTLIILGGRLLLPRLLREALRSGSLEVMLIVGIAAALGTGVLAAAIGFSVEMGAFLAGFILAATPFRHQLSGQIGPLRDLFIAVFFTVLGMELNLGIVAESWWVILLAVAVLLTVKAGLIGLTCWSVGTTASVAIAVGLSLSQAGEFSLILLQNARQLGLLDDDAFARIIAVVVLSLIVTPPLVDLGRLLAPRVAHVGTAPWFRQARFKDPPARRSDEPEEERKPHVIIGGYGPVGWMIAMELERRGIHPAVVELNPKTVKAQVAGGRNIHFGDISNPEVLEAAGLSHADALILTIPDEGAVLRACALARRISPKIFIAARISVVSTRSSAVQSGADHVTIDEIGTARSLMEAVTRHLSLDQRSS